MRLLIVTQEVNYDGDNLAFFHGWLERFAEEVDEVYVIANGIGAVTLPKNVTVVSLGKEHGASKLLKYIRFYRYTVQYLPKVDAVFVHMCPEYFAALYPLNLMWRKPVGIWYAHVQVSRLMQWVSRRVQVIFGPSPEAFPYPTDRQVSTGHGIDTDRFKPAEKQSDGKKTQLLYQGRITRVKEIELLFEALAILINEKNIHDIHLNLIGVEMVADDTVYRKELDERISKLALFDYVSWIGTVPNKDMARWYQNSDIFCRLQEGGGFGKSELEALSSGLPSITPTTVYNKLLPEFADDIYYPHRDVKALAERITSVKQWDQERRQQYQHQVRTLVTQNHNVDHVIHKIVTELSRYVRD